MKKENIIQKKEDFAFIIKNMKPIYSKNFRYHIYKKETNNYRFGFSISKKYGNAVERNLLKRRLKNIIKMYNIEKGLDIIIMPKTSVREITFNEMKSEIVDTLQSRNIIIGEKHEK